MVGKISSGLIQQVLKSGTQNGKKRASKSYQKCVLKNRDKTSNNAGLSGANKVRKMRKFRYEFCAKRTDRNAQFF